jgi:hypothetical protein
MILHLVMLERGSQEDALAREHNGALWDSAGFPSE